MVSTALASSLARRNIHYGWVVVAATFLTMLVTAGAMGAPGVLIKPLQDEFGWETSQISSALAIRLILFGLMGPFAAAFMNYFGVRKVIVFALALIGAGFVGSLFMTTLWQLLLLWGIVVGFGTGLTAMVLAATVSSTLVHQASRPRRRHALGKLGHRPARLPAFDGGTDGTLRLALDGLLRLRHDHGRSPCRPRLHARPAGRPQPALASAKRM